MAEAAAAAAAVPILTEQQQQRLQQQRRLELTSSRLQQRRRRHKATPGRGVALRCFTHGGRPPTLGQRATGAVRSSSAETGVPGLADPICWRAPRPG